MSIYDILEERGFVRQCSNELLLRELLTRSKVTYYVGFDPTADSLHIGSLMPIMAMAHLQRAGHIPIAIIGGGTTRIGDPSGKTELRRMMSQTEIELNGVKILEQLDRYLELDGKKGTFVNNADWLLSLKYIEFLRDIGRYFKVNEMIKVEAYRQRLEREEGLTFIEFNYQLLQAYDFLILFERYGCTLQMGGDDQWGNILAGIDLVRRVKGGATYALTFPLITTARGHKMGKTEAGTIWLDATKTSPYEFYQYWVNTDDRDVKRFLAYFTFLTMSEIEELSELQGSEIRKAKEILAFEATKLTHGIEEAEKARSASQAAFAKAGDDDLSAIPTTRMKKEQFVAGVLVVELFCEAGLTPTRSAARRLIEQGGAYVNDNKVASVDAIIKEDALENNSLLLRFGKKQYCRVVVE